MAYYLATLERWWAGRNTGEFPRRKTWSLCLPPKHKFRIPGNVTSCNCAMLDNLNIWSQTISGCRKNKTGSGSWLLTKKVDFFCRLKFTDYWILTLFCMYRVGKEEADPLFLLRNQNIGEIWTQEKKRKRHTELFVFVLLITSHMF